MPAGLTLVAWSEVLVLLLPLPITITTNLVAGGKRPALAAFNQVVLFSIPAFVIVLGLVEAVADARLRLNGLGLLLAGLVALAAELPAGRRRLGRVLPFDPDDQVHQLALVLTVLLVGVQLTTQLTTDVLAAAAQGQALSRLDLVLQELPFLLAAAFGVGSMTRRSPGETLERLGFVVPRWWQVVLALAASLAFLAIGNGIDRLGELITPALSHRIAQASDRLFGHLTDLGGIATLAVVAGVCEETLFRGALQPRFGLLWPAGVFAAVHTQYGLSFDTAAVVILAFGLALLRRYANTTTSALCHTTYDALVGLGLGRLGLPGAVAAEAVLLALLGAAWLMHRRRARTLTG